MFYVLCFGICFLRFLFCYLLLWRAIFSSVNLAWFMFYVLCLPFKTLILPVLSNNGKIKSSIAEFMFYVLAFIIIRDKSSGQYRNLLASKFYVNDLSRFMIYVSRFMIYVLYICPIYMFRIYDLPNQVSNPLPFLPSLVLVLCFCLLHKHKAQ